VRGNPGTRYFRISKQGFSISQELQIIRETIVHPIGYKEAGFSHGKIVCSGFYDRKPLIRKNGTKNALLKPVTKILQKIRFA
jgi:hypothetical protein